MVEDEQARFRKLPDGAWIPMDRCLREKNLLRASVSTRTVLEAFSPLEIDCGDTVYLGELEGEEDGELLIRVEHFVDEHQCAWLRQVWSEPGL